MFLEIGTSTNDGGCVRQSSNGETVFVDGLRSSINRIVENTTSSQMSDRLENNRLSNYSQSQRDTGVGHKVRFCN